MPQRIGNLALLSDCSTAALVERGGSVVWWPGRRFDGPSVFSRLLGEDAGHFEVAPAGQALTHVALVAAASAIEEAEARAGKDRLATVGNHG